MAIQEQTAMHRTLVSRLFFSVLTASLAMTATCAPPPVNTPPVSVQLGTPYERLSDFHFFLGTGATQEPNTGVIPYDVNSPLFSDYTSKHRFIYVPPGGTITYDAVNVWQLPAGSVVIKTFAYPRDANNPAAGERLLETRLLIVQMDRSITAHTYIWNEAQTEATRSVTGMFIPTAGMYANGPPIPAEYLVPNTSLCSRCHGNSQNIQLIGVRTRQLNRDHAYSTGMENQIDHFARVGLMTSAPPVANRERLENPTGSGTLEQRARSYLEANCAHCHSPTGYARSTGVYFTIESTQLGECARPAMTTGTGGRSWDIHPGCPEQSVMTFRMQSTDPAIRMPQIPNQVTDPAGISLVTEWIRSMPYRQCSTNDPLTCQTQ